MSMWSHTHIHTYIHMHTSFPSHAQFVDEISLLTSSWCNTEGQRHHERTCIDVDVVVVQAALAHIFDRHLSRKALILDIGVCIMEEK